MLITTCEEIRALLPTSLVANPNMLLTLTEDAEQDYIVPLLGDELYEHLQEAYNEALSAGISLSVGMMDPDPSELAPEIELIRICQRPILYCAIANNVGILSTNVNGGGGINVMSNDDFEAADDKRLDRLEKDCWRNAYRGMDRILLYLEKDAKKKKPSFADKWKNSDAFYLHEDLLFTTAECMNRYYNINGSREKYIQLIPEIRYCQSTYIAPQLGQELLSALIESETNPGIIPAEPSNASLVWRRVKEMARMSLGVFVSNRIEKKKKMDEGDAMVSLANAREYIYSYKDCFGDLYKSTPMYDASVDETNDSSSINEKNEKHI